MKGIRSAYEELPVQRGRIELPGGGALFLIDKPEGVTSHDVVDRVRALTQERRVGHGGTLDPMATGLLVIGVGRQATRLLDQELHGNKSYRAWLRLGLASTTHDRDAEGVREVMVPSFFDNSRIERALAEIVARGWQVPPMVSALKREGVALYKLARRGWWLEREARAVNLSEAVLEEKNATGPRCRMRITCGGGFYVRALVRDLGVALGVPAALEALRRLSVGPFSVEDAITLEEFSTGQLQIGDA